MRNWRPTTIGSIGRLGQALAFSFAILVPLSPVRAGLTGDQDRDGDVDLADFVGLQACFSGSDGVTDPDCLVFDLDDDGDVDLADLLTFQTQYTGPSLGASDFLSADPGDIVGVVDVFRRDGAPDVSGESGNADPREVEEADIIRDLDGYLYLLNGYRGLTILDVRNSDAPVIVGRLPLFGTPVEMYVRDNNVYAVITNYYRFAWDLADTDFRGSRIVVIDVADPSRPAVRSTFRLEGSVTATRRVGDVIYAASYRTPWWYDPRETEEQDDTFLVSINIADPDDVFEVERTSFGSGALDIHVTPEAVFVAGSDYIWPEPPRTRIQYVDISDPNGDIRLRGEFTVAGTIRNRFYMDAHAGAFRVVTQETRVDRNGRWSGTEVALHTFSLADPDRITPLARLPLVRDESLRAVRFDGNVGYAVTYFQIDPLWVIDLSDPSRPFKSGELHVPGWSTHIEPRGDRLIAVGFDDTDGLRPDVTLFDVSDPTRPTELSRIIVSGAGSWSWSLATSDEKALSIIDEAELIVLPFSYWDKVSRRQVHAAQLIDYTADRLSARGVITHTGAIQRTRIDPGYGSATIASDRLWLTSDLAFQVADISNRDRPRSITSVELAIDVMDYRRIGDVGVQLVRYGYDYRFIENGGANLELRTVSPADPDQMPPIGRVKVRVFNPQLFVYNDQIYLVGHDGNSSAGPTIIVHVSVADPARPVVVSRSKFDIRPYFSYGYGCRGCFGGGGSIWYAPGNSPIQLDKRFLAFLQPRTWVYDPESRQGHYENARLAVVDLAGTPTRPEPMLMADVNLGEIEPLGFFGRGRTAYFSSRQYVEAAPSQPSVIRYFLHRIDLNHAGQPALRDPVNVPGMGIDFHDDWIYTLDSQWDADGQLITVLNVVRIVDGRAILFGVHDVTGNIDQIRVVEGVAYLTTQPPFWWWFDGPVLFADVGVPVFGAPTFTLRVIDMRVPQQIVETYHETGPGYATLRAVSATRLVLDHSSSSALLVYDLADPLIPSLIDAFRLRGFYAETLRVEAETIVVTSGLSGVQVIETAE